MLMALCRKKYVLSSQPNERMNGAWSAGRAVVRTCAGTMPYSAAISMRSGIDAASVLVAKTAASRRVRMCVMTMSSNAASARSEWSMMAVALMACVSVIATILSGRGNLSNAFGGHNAMKMPRRQSSQPISMKMPQKAIA